MTTYYRIELPQDYGSEADCLALEEQFPNFEGDDLVEAAFDEIHRLWPGLDLIHQTEHGGVFVTSTPPPDDLPRWAWVEGAEWTRI